MTSYICFDKDFPLIHPISPLFTAELDELNFRAAFSKPIRLICFCTFDILPSSLSSPFNKISISDILNSCISDSF